MGINSLTQLPILPGYCVQTVASHHGGVTFVQTAFSLPCPCSYSYGGNLLCCNERCVQVLHNHLTPFAALQQGGMPALASLLLALCNGVVLEAASLSSPTSVPPSAAAMMSTPAPTVIPAALSDAVAGSSYPL